MRLTLEPGDELFGPRGHYIITNLVQEWATGFAESNVHYGDDAHGDLGVAAQFVDINRKVRVLRRAFWEGKSTTREDPRQILLELIGHCFLAVELLDRQTDNTGNPPPAAVQEAWDNFRRALTQKARKSPLGERWVSFVDGGGRGRSGPQTEFCKMETASNTDHSHDIRCVGEAPR